jgi:hypothetical protein
MDSRKSNMCKTTMEIPNSQFEIWRIPSTTSHYGEVTHSLTRATKSKHIVHIPWLLLVSSPLLSSALTWWEMKREDARTHVPLRCEAFSFQTEAIYQGTNPLPGEGRQSRLYGAQRTFDNKKVL